MELETDFSLEKNLARLRQVVELMQKGMGNLDEHMALYREGQELVVKCRKYLEQADLQVAQLLDGEVSAFESSEWREDE